MAFQGGLPALMSGPCLSFQDFFLFFFFNVYFIFERKRQSVNRGGAEREREGDTESETGSRLQAASIGPDTGLKPTNHEITT